MGILDELREIHRGNPEAFMIHGSTALAFDRVDEVDAIDLGSIASGDVVALIGDFEPRSINTLLRLIDRKAVLVPLTTDTRPSHRYFFESACVDVVIEGDRVERIAPARTPHPLLDILRDRGHAGLVLFSSGTTGRPKAILHDFELFLARYRTPRPALRTLNFLLFDHIGGINTLLHTLYNRGVVVIPTERTPEAVLDGIDRHQVELLPTTPTFLRVLLMSGLLEERALRSLRIVTYGTERMDQPTLDRLCELMPGVDFRQTYGMSELGILRIKSEARNSLWMQVGGEGVRTRVADGVLQIHARNRMLGYLNAPSPFDDEGWYDTKDLVETKEGGWVKVVGRTSDVISVGGLKVLPQEIERAALLHPGVMHAKAYGVDNPITGQHIELICEPKSGVQLDRRAMRAHMLAHIAGGFMPHRIKIGKVGVGHRFKKQ
ncbi:MAG TPA: long-chain fatty acid--CoA ligase [Microvirga sp.]|nr:long-chain fatty acid--CoA ligase [Microvirga sp.]